MKLLILIAVHGRHHITELCYRGLNHLIENAPQFDIRVLIVGDCQQHKAMALQNKYHWYEHKNLPLGQKLNAALSHAMQWDWEYMMQLGSDDIMLPELLAAYEPYFNSVVPVFGVNNIFFIEHSTQRIQFFRYDNPSIIIGAGRCISRQAIEASASCVKVRMLIQMALPIGTMEQGEVYSVTHRTASGFIERNVAELVSDEPHIYLWLHTANRALDHYSMMQLEKKGYSHKTVPFDYGLFDIKSDENIWKFEQMPGEEIKINECNSSIKKSIEALRNIIA